MDIELNTSYRVAFGTADPSTGAATDADSTPSCVVLEQGTALGYSPTVTNKAVGLYEVAFDCSAGNGFEVGKEYTAYVVVVLGGTTAREGIAAFKIRSSAPDANVASISNNAITAAAIANGAIDRATFAQDALDLFREVRRNTAQGGATQSITLDAGASSTNDLYVGMIVVIVGGTGAGQARRIRDYTGASKVAVTMINWAINPDNTSVFVIFADAGAIEDDGIFNSSFLSGAITSSKIAAGAITASQIAADAIGATQIAANAITSAKIAANAITSSQIAADAIGATQIAANAITSSKIAANAITSTQIAANAIGAAQIANGAIDAATFAAGAIDATAIAANAISAAKIAADALAAISDTIWDEVLSGHLVAGSTGAALDAATSGGGPTAAAIADAVWDEARASHVTPGSFGEGVPVTSLATDSITSTAVAASAVTELQTGLATAAALATAQTTLNTVNSNIGTPTGASVSADIATLSTKVGTPAGASVSADIASVKSDTSSSNAAISAIATDVNNLEKIALGRWKIQGTQLILYELDGTTPYKTFNLLDDTGTPSNTRIFERVPV